MCGTYSKTMAVRQLEAAFAEMTPDGMIPNFGAQRASSLDRSQPPLGSYCLLKLYHQHQDRELVLENRKQESGEIDHFPYQESRYRVKTGIDSGCWKDSSPIENK